MEAVTCGERPTTANQRPARRAVTMQIKGSGYLEEHDGHCSNVGPCDTPQEHTVSVPNSHWAVGFELNPLGSGYGKSLQEIRLLRDRLRTDGGCAGLIAFRKELK
jgi:hypothetical protein